MPRVGIATLLATMAMAAGADAARPDLVVTALRIESGSQVRATVANRGRVPARATRTGLFVSRDRTRSRGDRRVGTLSTAAIAARRSRTVARRLAIGDAAFLLACADVSARVRESSERNNCRSARLAAPGAVPAPVATPPAPAPAPTTTPAPANEPCAAGTWRAELCAAIAERFARREFADVADVITFSLLFQHLKTQQVVPRSVAAAAIEAARTAPDPISGHPAMRTYRFRGFLTFWAVGPGYAGIDWPRLPDSLTTMAHLEDFLVTYRLVQSTALINATNQFLEALLNSELAWRNALADWKAHDDKIVSAQQYSDATVNATLTSYSAYESIRRAGYAIG